LSRILAAIVLVVAVLAAPAGRALETETTGQAAPTFDQQAALTLSRGAVGNQVGDLVFRNRAGETVSLSSFRGKPLIVSMIFTSCANFCLTISQALANAADIAAEAMGADSFNIVSVGFDTAADTPTRMASFARREGLDAANWFFLSTDEKTAQALSREIGFTFAPSPAGFDHVAQTTILDAEGRVFQQVYGTDFAAPFLVEPLKDLVFGRSSQLASLEGLVNRVRLFCTVFNPATGRYTFDYSLFIVLGVGSLCLSLVGGFAVRAWLKTRPGVREA